MTKTFIQTEEFLRNWEELGFNDDDLRKLELELLKNPQSGSVVRGTGRLRKMRFALPNRGKSGGVRVCYVDFVIQEAIYLVTVYAKKQKDNLTQEERSAIKKMIKLLEESLIGEEIHEKCI